MIRCDVSDDPKKLRDAAVAIAVASLTAFFATFAAKLAERLMTPRPKKEDEKPTMNDLFWKQRKSPKSGDEK